MKNQNIANPFTVVAITVAACIVTALATCYFTLYYMQKKMPVYTRLQEVMGFVQDNYYIAPDEDTQNEMIDSMLEGYVSALGDTYSCYMTEEEYTALLTKESGQYAGIGITVQQTDNGYLEVMSVTQDSPADNAGIKAGDILISVESKDIAEIGYTDAIGMIQGEDGEAVTLTILHDDTEQEYTLVREIFDLPTIESYMLDGQIGYIKITSFRENTDEQFQEALQVLLDDGAQALIFDVRNNGGGMLSSLSNMLDPLLPEGDIAIATYQGGITETVMTSDAEELDMPMAVLVNGSSASAAELFSASLRDFRNAKLVGTQTFGKGIMQVTTKLENGGGLTLTVATYQTTKSDCYHEVGLEPDVIVEVSEDFTIPDEPDIGNDPQLAAAVALFR